MPIPVPTTPIRAAAPEEGAALQRLAQALDRLVLDATASLLRAQVDWSGPTRRWSDDQHRTLLATCRLVADVARRESLAPTTRPSP